MIRSSARLTLLEHFRVPHEVDPDAARNGVEHLGVSSEGPELLWPAELRSPARAASTLGADGRTTIPLFVPVLGDGAAEPMLARAGGGWTRAREITAPGGERLGSIWRREDGSVFLPFDPNEVVTSYWSERYLVVANGDRRGRLRRRSLRAYYRARPLLPRQLQILLRRRLALRQARSPFPQWPLETGLHDFFDLMFAILEGIAGAPIPYISAWPGDHAWALVLTHDVERAEGLTMAGPVLELERERGLRSSWNLVPRDYPVDDEWVSKLLDAGFEVGVHGLRHDGRDLESLARWQSRLTGINEAARRWGASGFRSASLHRRWDWMRLLDCDYDSSYPDTDPFEPQNGGCCTWLPFFNGELVELPLTLPQDHTLFVILRHANEAAWVQKTEALRERGGMALIDTHPDYLVDERVLSAYTRFLDRFRDDDTAWKALPREVSAWWRRRAASGLETDGESWRITGPAAADGRVGFLGGSW